MLKLPDSVGLKELKLLMSSSHLKYSVLLVDVVLLAVNSIFNCSIGSTVLLKVKFSDEFVLYMVLSDVFFDIQPFLPAVDLISFWLPKANGKPGDN